MGMRAGVLFAGLLALAACGSPPESSGSAAQDEERPEDRETVMMKWS